MRKANVFKKALSGVLALSTALSVGFIAGCGDDEPTADKKEEQTQAAFIEEIGGVSETYNGSVSNENYASAPAAAEAYIETEVVGNKNATVVNTAKKADLNQTQIAQLNIETTETILGVEEYEVEYVEDAVVPMATQQNNTKKVKVYIIKFENHWEYYAPCPVTGETITKSYYDSVFESDAYKNCTYSNATTMNMTTVGAAQGMTVTMTVGMSLTQLIKYQDGKIYMEQTSVTTMKMEMPNAPAELNENETESSTIYAYITQEDDQLVCYAKVIQDGETIKNWTRGDIYTIGFSSVDDLLPFVDGYLDYTYFTKTNFGFELSGEQAERYLSETLDELAAYQDVIKDMDIKTLVKYYVQNGALTGLRQDLTIAYDQVFQGVNTKLDLSLTTKGTVKDYGSTVVEKPAEIAE
ncbi:MAG: hypothetical protein E7355_01305 [Clostridiales bacterium]|nr:hypothetical protein [Clostridiales bacterium]